MENECIQFNSDHEPIIFYAMDELYGPNSDRKDMFKNVQLELPYCMPTNSASKHASETCGAMIGNQTLDSPMANLTSPISRIVINRNSIINVRDFISSHYMPDNGRGVFIRIFTDFMDELELTAVHYLFQNQIKAHVQLYMITFDEQNGTTVIPEKFRSYNWHSASKSELSRAMEQDNHHKFLDQLPYCLSIHPDSNSGIETEKEPKWKHLILLSSILVGIIGCGFGVCFYCKARKTKMWRKVWKKQSEIAAKNSSPDTTNNSVKMRYIELPNNIRQLAGCIIEHDKWEVSRTHVKVDYNTKLGSGAFSTVYKGQLTAPRRNDQNKILAAGEILGTSVAVKMLPLYADFNAKMDFIQEINFMKDLVVHPHLVNLVACITLEDPLSLLSEFCEHGDLLKLVRDRKEAIIDDKDDLIQQKTLFTFAWQISDALAHLTSKGIIHRDIAARNVLITKDLIAKVGDFGLCRLADRNLYTTRGGRLPMKWMPPESLKHYEYSDKSDVWSYGVLLWEMYSLGDVPYAWVQPTDLADHLALGKRLDQPELCPEEVYCLMKKCWSESANDRPTAAELRQSLAEQLAAMNDKNYNYVKPITAASDVVSDNEEKQIDKLAHQPTITKIMITGSPKVNR